MKDNDTKDLDEINENIKLTKEKERKRNKKES